MARTLNPPRFEDSLRRRRARRPSRPSSLSILTVLVFCALCGLAATLFCWQLSAYRNWVSCDKNPREGVLIHFSKIASLDVMSAFEVKNPTLIREELATPPLTGGTRIHFICPVSQAGNFLMIYLFRNSEDCWIYAIPIP